MVSHSRPLAVAAAGLAREMVHGQEVRLAVAAGLDETTLGTDAVQIAAAIEEVDGPDGVVVLMDLGSAVLSSEMALELLSDPLARDRVVLSPAPIVEGLIVAAVTAAGGADRAHVAAEAGMALLAKTSHLPVAQPVPPGAADTAALHPDPPRSPVGTVPAPEHPDAVGVLTVLNEHGLHARPAARLVHELQGLDAQVRLRKVGHPGEPVAARSLSRVATLGARQGDRVEVTASGPQAHEAVRRLVELARRHFDETGPGTGTASPGPPPTPTGATPLTTGGRVHTGRPAAPGIAIGPVTHLVETAVDLDAADLDAADLDATDLDAVHDGEHPPDVVDARWRRVRDAVAATAAEVAQVRATAVVGVGDEEARIFDAHLALLADEEMLSDVHDRLVAGEGAPRAWAATLADLEGRWAALDDPYLRERAADVAAVAQQVLRRLVGVAEPRPSGRGVLLAADLTPAQTASLDADLVTGVVLAAGSATSHAAILARARGLPMVVAAGQAVLGLADGTPVALDGSTGELHLDPPADVLARFEERARTRAARTRRDMETAQQQAVTRDGVRVHVLANIGSQADAVAAAAAGAEGAGLVRTELFFMDRSAPPSTAEQQEEYTAISRSLPGRRLTLRTMDIGGDKPLSYLPLPVEANPFLGLRGLRLGLHRPDLLAHQLAAICATARLAPVDVMFPMVSTLDELLQARRILIDAAGPDGLPEGLRIGMMVEVPAAALKIASFVPHLDFVSIGTNDLTQYTLAAERGNPSVANLSDPLDPGVLRLVDTVCRAAGRRVVVTVCGEAASDEQAVPVLVGLGVQELSVAPAAVPAVKAAVRALETGRCRELAGRALDLADAGQVRALVRAELGDDLSA